jgi:predicted aspartyl protease
MRLRHLGLLLGGTVFGAARMGAEIHESAPLFTRITQTAVIPAEVSGHGLFVSVMINGQGPFRMQVDTGCTYTVISPEVAAAVEARGTESEEDDTETVNGLGDAISVPRVLLDSVTVGGVEFEGVDAGVVPLELQSKVDSHQLDGLLGYTLFSDLFVALDFPSQHLVLSNAWPKDLPPVRAELPVQENSEVPFIPVTLQGKDFEVMIDTGASDRLHLPPEAAATLDWKTEPRLGLLLAVAGEVGQEKEGRASGTLALGAVEQLNPVIGISAGSANLGVGLLHTFCLVFHEAENKFWLLSEEAGTIPSPPDLTVGMSMFAEAGGWRVAGIIPNSPAEQAAIVKGDLLTQIEGRPARAWTRDQIQAWVDTHPTLTVRVSAAAGERDIVLRVWALVP